MLTYAVVTGIRVIRLFLLGLAIVFLNACTLDARFTDLNSKSSADSNVTDPNQPVTSPDGSITLNSISNYINTNNQNAFSISGSCNKEGALIEVLIDAIVQSTTTTCVSGAWSLNLNLTAKAENSYTVAARITPDSGAGVSTSNKSLIKDITSPDVSGISLDDKIFYNSLTQSPVITWSAAIETGSGIDKYEMALGTVLGGTDV